MGIITLIQIILILIVVISAIVLLRMNAKKF